MNGCYNTMGIDRVRGSAGVAACVLAVAAAFAPGLAAQGAKEANGRGRPSATVAGPSSHLQPARGILGDLVGTWQFQIWFAGNFSGTPDVSGIRVMRSEEHTSELQSLAYLVCRLLLEKKKKKRLKT